LITVVIVVVVDGSVSAYAKLSELLMTDLQGMTVDSDCSQQMNNMRSDNQFLKSESVRIHTTLAEMLSKKEQLALALQAENEILEFKNKSLLMTVDLLNSELERSKRALTEMQEANVELFLHGSHMKGEIDRCSKNILHSVEAKMGFVPRAVITQVGQLRQVPASS
jgi:hypothetical protein